MLVEYDPKKLVVQHKRFINARFDMNMNQLRIFVYMLLQIKKDDTQFRRIRIPCQMLHASKRKVHYEDIRKAADELSKKAIEIITLTKDNRKRWEKINLMSSCSYTEREGHIEASFNPEAAPYLLNLSENFKAVEYRRWSEINSYYSYRFFWLLAQFEDTGYFEVKLQDLKEMLYIENKYNRYYDFKRYVLKPVQKDLAKNNFPFDFKEEKDRSRNVVKLKFFFGKRIKTIPTPSPTPQPKKLEIKQQTEISFNQKPNKQVEPSSQIERQMIQLGFSILDIEHYQEHIPAKELKKSVYGLYTNWTGSDTPLRKVHQIARECLDNLVGEEVK